MQNIVTCSFFSILDNKKLYEIMKLRQDVFVLEQNCLYPDLDDIDKRAWHVTLYRGETLACYARVFEVGDGIVKIGRVVTARKYRRKGLASLVMHSAKEQARRMDASQIVLEAQTYAVPFYQKCGFHPVGEEFLEDGIPHVRMIYDVK